MVRFGVGCFSRGREGLYRGGHETYNEDTGADAEDVEEGEEYFFRAGEVAAFI